MAANENIWNDSNERLVLYLDIMGFKERVSRTNIETLKEQLLAFKTQNIKLSPLLRTGIGDAQKELMKMAQFSDSTVVVSAGKSKHDLNRITRAAVILMQTALRTGFALRGVIACGNMVFDEENQLFFGKALVDAYNLEEQLSFYGVVFHESVERIVKQALQAPNRTYFPIKDEAVYTKGGKSAHYHVAWYEMKEDLAKGSIKDQAIEWLTKLRESVSGIPRIYLDNTLKILKCENI